MEKDTFSSPPPKSSMPPPKSSMPPPKSSPPSPKSSRPPPKSPLSSPKSSMPPPKSPLPPHKSPPPPPKSSMPPPKSPLSSPKSSMPPPKSPLSSPKSSMPSPLSPLSSPKSSMPSPLSPLPPHKSPPPPPKSSMPPPKSPLSSPKSSMPSPLSPLSSPKSSMPSPLSPLSSPKSSMPSTLSPLSSPKSSMPPPKFSPPPSKSSPLKSTSSTLKSSPIPPISSPSSSKSSSLPLKSSPLSPKSSPSTSKPSSSPLKSSSSTPNSSPSTSKSSPEKRKLQPATKIRNDVKFMRLIETETEAYFSYEPLDMDVVRSISDRSHILVDEDYMQIRNEPGLYKKFVTVTEEDLGKDDELASTSETENPLRSPTKCLPIIMDAEAYLDSLSNDGDHVNFTSEAKMWGCKHFSKYMCDVISECAMLSVSDVPKQITPQDWTEDKFDDIILYFKHTIIDVLIERVPYTIECVFTHLEEEDKGAIVELVSTEEFAQISTYLTEELSTKFESIISYSVTDGLVIALSEQTIPVEGHSRTITSTFHTAITTGVTELLRERYIQTVVEALPEVVRALGGKRKQEDKTRVAKAAGGDAELDVAADGVVSDASVSDEDELAEENDENINLSDIVQITCQVADLYNHLRNGQNNDNSTINIDLLKMENAEYVVAQGLMKPEDVPDYERITRYFQNRNTPNERFEAHINYVRNKLILRYREIREKWIAAREDIARVHTELRNTGIFTQQMLNILQFENELEKDLIFF